MTVTSLSIQAPITALCSIAASASNSAFLLAGSADQLVASALDSSSPSTSSKRWKVFKRERVHRIISEVVGDSWRVLVSGGKEAALLQLRGSSVAELELHVLERFVLSDWVQDVAFLGTDSFLFLTAHNTILHYITPPSSFPDPPASPELRRAIHPPLRPLLWCGAFSQTSYNALEEVKVAAGSMLGDVLSWSLAEAVINDGEEAILGDGVVTRLEGHQGAIFTVSFSPSGRYLVTGSDDRTVRVWDLQADGGPALYATLWGHEGRVWRARWLDEGEHEARLVSVAEDACCMIWSLALTSSAAASSSSDSAELAYSLLKTYQNGHDGKSMWSVCSAVIDKQVVVLTGGADGGVRSWLAPRGQEQAREGGAAPDKNGFLEHLDPFGVIKALCVVEDPRSGAQEALFLNAEGALYHSTLSSLASNTPSSPRLIHQSPHLRSPCLLHLYLPPTNASGSPHTTGLHAQAWIFTNRGHAFRLAFTLDGASCGAEQVQVQVLEAELGVAAMSMQIDREAAELEKRVALNVRSRGEPIVTTRSGRETMVALLERKGGGRVVLVSMGDDNEMPILASLAFDGPAFPSPKDRQITCVSFIPSPPSVAEFASTPPAALLLLGSSSGALTLASLCTNSGATRVLARLPKVHLDSVTDIASLSGSWKTESGSTLRGRVSVTRGEVESVGRDGVRAVVRVERSFEVYEGECGVKEEWSMELLGQQMVSRGLVDQILPSTSSPASTNHCARRYLAMHETDAVVLDEAGTRLTSFISPGTSIPKAMVDDERGTHYYRIVNGRIHAQFTPHPKSSLPRSILLPGLHGREIRCVALHRHRLSSGQSIILAATGAENAVLKISLVDPLTHALTPLYTDRSIPSARKSVVWSAPTSYYQEELYLFSSGAGEMLQVCRVSISASTTATSASISNASDSSATAVHTSLPTVKLHVRPWTAAKALTSKQEEKEKGSVRVMDLAVQPLPSAGGQKHVVLAGYSDGKLRVYLFDAAGKSLELVAQSAEFGKCVLTVKLVRVEERCFVISGASDGLLAITDITSLVESLTTSATTSLTTLPPVLLSFRPHQSGINGLDVLWTSTDRTLRIATAGDDNAVGVRQIFLSTCDGLLKLEEHSADLPHAHGSTIQGLHFLSPSLLCSTSVDQRLNVYRYSSSALVEQDGATSRPTLRIAEGACLGTADCSAMDVLREERDESQCGGEEGPGCWLAVTVGIGAEVVRVEV